MYTPHLVPVTVSLPRTNYDGSDSSDECEQKLHPLLNSLATFYYIPLHNHVNATSSSYHTRLLHTQVTA